MTEDKAAEGVIDESSVDEAIRAQDERVRRTEESVEYHKRLLSQDRSKIAKRIIWLFMIASLGTILFIAYAVLWSATPPASGWENAAQLMVTILSSVILPVVTLVIGYYFGSEAKEQ